MKQQGLDLGLEGDSSYKGNSRNGRIKSSYCTHGLNPSIHTHLEDFEDPLALQGLGYISKLVNSVLLLSVYIYVFTLSQDLVGSTHLKETSRCLVVTVPNSLDDGLDFRPLD